MFKKSLLFIVILTLVSSGCSLLSTPQGEEVSKANVGKKKPGIEDFKAATEVEEMLREGPGIFAGDQYDEEKLRKELDKFPEDLTGEEVYNRLIYLLAEDYEPLIDEMKNLDVTHTFDRKMPKRGNGESDGGESSQVNVVILLDASGSMKEKVSGQVKMELAKESIQRFVSELPEGTQVSLRVFGHKEGKSKKESCQSSETVYPLSTYEESRFSSALNRFDAQGWTPLAKAIRDAKSDLTHSSGEGVQNLVYIVSDGEETCGGDPVKEARALHTSEMKAIVNIIGFDVSNAEQRALKEVARAGGGTYKSARSASDLEEQLRKERRQLMNELNEWTSLTIADLNKRRDEMLREKGKIAEELYDLKSLESRRLSNAWDYVVRTKQMKAENIHTTMFRLLRNRSDGIHDYIGNLNKDTSNRISNSYLDALQELRKKRREIEYES